MWFLCLSVTKKGDPLCRGGAIDVYKYKRFRSPGFPFQPKGMQIGSIVFAEGKRVYHAEDTDFILEMWRMRDIDVAFLPIIGWTTIDLGEVVEAAIALYLKVGISMHSRDVDAEEFKDAVEIRSDVKVLVIPERD